MNDRPQVLIEVRGGVAYYETHGDVDVFLVDYDNEPDAEIPEAWDEHAD